MNKPLVAIVFLIAISVHLGALFQLHNSTFTMPAHPFFKPKSLEVSEEDLRLQKTRALAEIFCTPPLLKHRIQESLADLSQESCVLPSLALEPLQLSAGYEFRSQLTHLPPPEIVAQLPGTDEKLPLGEIQSAPLDLLQMGDEIDVQVEYTPRRARGGYIFKLTLTPRPEVTREPLSQNHLFLIDRSTSVAKTHYLENKQAVARALSLLNEGQTFNIYLFDDKLIPFSKTPVPKNKQTLQKAHEFLSKQGHGGFFAAADLYKTLCKLHATLDEEEQINLAFLLSDGATYHSREKKRQTLYKWTQINQGKLSLYGLSSGKGVALEQMGFLCAFNKGKLSTTPDHSRMSDLIESSLSKLQRPLVTQLSATALCGENEMILHPYHLPDLYQEASLVLYGYTKHLGDITLFVQGDRHDKPVMIRKEVALKEGTIASLELEKRWAELCVQHHLMNYFEEGTKGHLEAAREQLLDLDLPLPNLIKK